MNLLFNNFAIDIISLITSSLDIENFDSEASNNAPTLGVQYEAFTVPLIKVVQTLIDDIKLLQIDVTELESKFQ